jgi:hypothetical protein
MTPEQRYLFDTSGYLHLKNVLSTDEIKRAWEAAERYRTTPQEELPAGFAFAGKGYDHGFAFDKALEALTMHPAYWPIIKELSDDKPRFGRGTMLIDTHDQPVNITLHCARDDFGWQTTQFIAKNGRIFCDNFVIFPYLTDVYPGDGGLIVVPGSHKSQFERPKDFFYPRGASLGDYDVTEIPDGVIHLAPRAGDVLIISELLTHGTLPWKPKDRDRRTLTLRYSPQYFGNSSHFPDEIKARLSPTTLELTDSAPYDHLKEIVKLAGAPRV